MKISVIIPTYRPGAYIFECLDSLRHQTLPKNQFEVIVVLNGERNPYEEQLFEYSFHVNLLVFHVYNLGPLYVLFLLE